MNQTKEWLKFRESQSTGHIATCRGAWHEHTAGCRQCYFIELYAPEHCCEQGKILYGEYAASITANPACEHLTMEEPCLTTKT